MNGLSSASHAGHGLVVVSAWLALFLYPAGLAGGGVHVPEGRARLCRLLFSLGGVVFLVHAASAFVVHYDLSHTVALEKTALETAELAGVETGAGLYLNYLFAVLWWVEIAWWQAAPVDYRSRNRSISAAVHGFFLFMIVNGAIVFVGWPQRVLGIGVLLLCAVALWFRLAPEARLGCSDWLS